MAKPDPAADLAACVQALQDIIAAAPQAAHAIAEKALAGIVMGRMGGAAAAPGRVVVQIPQVPGDVRRGWAKWVFRTDPKARGGFMFEGPFLRLGRPSALPPGAVVLVVHAGEKGAHTGYAYIVQDDGSLSASLRSPRGAWGELATMIGDYLDRGRDFTARQWPIVQALPQPPPAPAAAPPAAADQP